MFEAARVEVKVQWLADAESLLSSGMKIRVRLGDGGGTARDKAALRLEVSGETTVVELKGLVVAGAGRCVFIDKWPCRLFAVRVHVWQSRSQRSRLRTSVSTNRSLCSGL